MWLDVGGGWAVMRSKMGKVFGVSVKLLEYYCGSATKNVQAFGRPL